MSKKKQTEVVEEVETVEEVGEGYPDEWPEAKEIIGSGKSLGNTDTNGATKNVPDIEFYGNGDTFQLLCKASSEKEGWMKSTKAMNIVGVGAVVQVTTQQGDRVAEALTFVPGVQVAFVNSNDHSQGRQLVKIR